MSIFNSSALFQVVAIDGHIGDLWPKFPSLLFKLTIWPHARFRNTCYPTILGLLPYVAE
jgi:hypothetical protein